MVTHVLLLEASERLVLVDCGVSARDILNSRERLGRGWIAVTRPALQLELTARHQIAELACPH